MAIRTGVRPRASLLLGVNADIQQPADAAGIPVDHRVQQGAAGGLDSDLGKFPESACFCGVSHDTSNPAATNTGKLR